jgi:hypothetical protein
MEKLADLHAPEFKEVSLLGGKRAVVGPFTFDVIYWIEEKYGDFATFQKTIAAKSLADWKLTEIVELLYQMLHNRDDFKDARDFARHVPFSRIDQVITVLSEQMGASYPVEPAGAAAAADDDAPGKP